MPRESVTVMSLGWNKSDTPEAAAFLPEPEFAQAPGLYSPGAFSSPRSGLAEDAANPPRCVRPPAGHSPAGGAYFISASKILRKTHVIVHEISPEHLHKYAQTPKIEKS